MEKRAEKVLARAPPNEEVRIRVALVEMSSDPFSGDVARLKHERTAFRRRVGDWRIFFDVDHARRLVQVRLIERRTTTTYRRR